MVQLTMANYKLDYCCEFLRDLEVGGKYCICDEEQREMWCGCGYVCACRENGPLMMGSRGRYHCDKCRTPISKEEKIKEPLGCDFCNTLLCKGCHVAQSFYYCPVCTTHY
jgi:hypothetical protein